MKLRKINIVALTVLVLGLGSCLKKNASNIDISDTTGPVLTLQFIENGSGTTINSGLQYFSGGALTYPSTEDEHVASFNVKVGGSGSIKGDVNVTLGIDASKKLDNYKNDSIAYDIMPDSLFSLSKTSVTIPAGSKEVPVEITFYPSKIDPTQSYILPIKIMDASGHNISSNFGTIYFHVIGNPLAGAYLWDFFRYNTLTITGSPGTTWLNEDIIFSPVNPTTIKVPTGYYVQPNYQITFKNTGGVLSDFKAVIAPDEITAAFTNNGIAVIEGPTIDVTPDYKKLTVHYVVYNGSAYRNITDIYHR